jgi:hypothetical protein
MVGLPSVSRGIWGLGVFTADRNNTSCTAIFCLLLSLIFTAIQYVRVLSREKKGASRKEIRVKSSNRDKRWGSLPVFYF